MPSWVSEVGAVWGPVVYTSQVGQVGGAEGVYK